MIHRVKLRNEYKQETDKHWTDARNQDKSTPSIEYGKWLENKLRDIENTITQTKEHEPDFHERIFVCDRCDTEYSTFSTEANICCCIMPVSHRTSGICGGGLEELRKENYKASHHCLCSYPWAVNGECILCDQPIKK